MKRHPSPLRLDVVVLPARPDVEIGDATPAPERVYQSRRLLMTSMISSVIVPVPLHLPFACRAVQLSPTRVPPCVLVVVISRSVPHLSQVRSILN